MAPTNENSAQSNMTSEVDASDLRSFRHIRFQNKEDEQVDIHSW